MEACSQALGLGGHWGRNGCNCCWCICPKDDLSSTVRHPARSLVDMYHLAHMVPPDHILSARKMSPFPFTCPGFWLDDKGVKQECGKVFRSEEVRLKQVLCCIDWAYALQNAAVIITLQDIDKDSLPTWKNDKSKLLANAVEVHERRHHSVGWRRSPVVDIEPNDTLLILFT